MRDDKATDDDSLYPTTDFVARESFDRRPDQRPPHDRTVHATPARKARPIRSEDGIMTGQHAEAGCTPLVCRVPPMTPGAAAILSAIHGASAPIPVGHPARLAREYVHKAEPSDEPPHGHGRLCEDGCACGLVRSDIDAADAAIAGLIRERDELKQKVIAADHRSLVMEALLDCETNRANAETSRASAFVKEAGRLLDRLQARVNEIDRLRTKLRAAHLRNAAMVSTTLEEIDRLKLCLRDAESRATVAAAHIQHIRRCVRLGSCSLCR